MCITKKQVTKAAGNRERVGAKSDALDLEDDIS
jgi:hypothetical protein